MKYLIIIILVAAGSYYFQQNISDCETEADIRAKSLDFMDRINEIARQNNSTKRLSYYDIQQTLGKIKAKQGGEINPSATCFALDVMLEAIEEQI